MTIAISIQIFAQRALGLFPDLAEEFEALDEMPSLRMTAFGSRLQRAKGEADWDSYAKGIQLVQDVWDRADPELEKRLKTSFMRALQFDGLRGPIAWEYLSPELRLAWESARKKAEALNAQPRKAKKPKKKGR